MDGHDDVSVGGQGALEGPVHPAALGPVLHQNHQLLQPGVDLRVLAEHDRVLHRQEVVDADVALDAGLRLDEFHDGHPGLGDGDHAGHAVLPQEIRHRLDDLLLRRLVPLAAIAAAHLELAEVQLLALLLRVGLRGVVLHAGLHVNLNGKVDVVVLANAEVVGRGAKHVEGRFLELLPEDPLNLLEALLLHGNFLLGRKQP
mmetsp:Transcript_14017/g.35274  ORF Transcript_14017/g.35274 Transcript_14017/m.35274 type:complete len:201 (-) Transcript_14017:323-925(-)